MRMGQGVRTGLGHGGITCVLQTQFSSFSLFSTVLPSNGYKICWGTKMFDPLDDYKKKDKYDPW